MTTPFMLTKKEETETRTLVTRFFILLLNPFHACSHSKLCNFRTKSYMFTHFSQQQKKQRRLMCKPMNLLFMYFVSMKEYVYHISIYKYCIFRSGYDLMFCYNEGASHIPRRSSLASYQHYVPP